MLQIKINFYNLMRKCNCNLFMEIYEAMNENESLKVF